MRHKIIIALFTCLLFSLVRVNAINMYENSEVSVELIRNTDQCLIDCEAELQICSKSGTLTLTDSNFDFWFVDTQANTRDDIEYKIVKEDKENYYVEQNIIESCQREVCYDHNLTKEQTCVYVDDVCITGTKQTMRTKTIENEYNPLKSNVNVDGCTNLVVKGKKKPLENIDWKIDILGIEPDWAWWNSDWSYKRVESVNKSGASDLTNFTYLVNATDYIDTATLISDNKMNASCYDIRFTNGTEEFELDYEFEAYADGTYGCDASDTLIWLQTDYLKGDNTTTNYFYYGNNEATFGNDTENTWDDNYMHVFHLSSLIDSTNVSNVLTNVGGNSSAGRFANSYDLERDDSEHLYWIPNSQSDIDTDFTLEFWVKHESNVDTYYVTKGDGGNWNYYTQMASNTLYCGFKDDGGTWQYASYSITPSVGSWYYWVCRVNSTTVTIFSNGVEVGVPDTSIGTPDDSLSHEATIGGSQHHNSYFDGVIDEVRLSNVARSNEYIERMWNYGLQQLGEEETTDSVAPTYSGITEPTDPSTYDPNGFQFNITVVDADSDVDVVEIEFNGTKYVMDNETSEYYYTASLGAGVWNYTFYMNDTFDNTNQTDYYTFTVNRGTSAIDLLLNSTDGNFEYLNTTAYNFTAILSGLNVNMSTNISVWVDQLNKASPYENISTLSCDENNTYYNVTAWFDGNENYTGSWETHYGICYVQPPVPAQNFTTVYCSGDGQYLVTNETANGVSTYANTYCEYNCTETILGTRCDYSPSIKGFVWVAIIFVLLGTIYLVYKMLRGMIR